MVNKLRPTDQDINDLQEKVGTIPLSLLLLLSLFLLLNWNIPLCKI